MAFNSDNYLVIGSDMGQGSQNYYIHERETNKDGTPGKIVTFADGKGNVIDVAKSYVEKGFKPDKIIINGQPATDVFEKTRVDNDENLKKKSKLDTPEVRNFARAMMAVSYPGLYIATSMYRPDITTPEKV